jgi:hypothetical protein
VCNGAAAATQSAAGGLQYHDTATTYLRESLTRVPRAFDCMNFT